MSLFRKKSKYQDAQEARLDAISDLTRGLERKEFNSLLDAVKMVFEARQKLKNVKTSEEKENEDIDEAERILEKESKK